MSEYMRYWVGFAVSVALCSGRGLGQELDLSFGDNGSVRYSVFPGQPTLFLDMMVQSDGRIVTSGCADSAGYFQAIVVRTLPNGDPDPTFGNSGVYQRHTSHNTNNRYLRILPAPDSSGDLIAMGSLESPLGDFRSLGATRLTNAGVPANWNGPSGTRVVGFEGENDPLASGGFVHADGTMTIVGGRYAGPDNIVTVVRMLASGDPDTDFGGGTGQSFSDIAGSFDFGLDVERDNAGGYVVAVHSDSEPWAIRLNPDGSRDNAFCGAGTYYSFWHSASRVGFFPNGDILLVGYDVVSDEGVVARLAPNGTPDASWGANGARTYSIPNYWIGFLDYVWDPLGGLLLCGYAHLPVGEGVSNGLVARLLSNGTLDPDFGEDGFLFTPEPLSLACSIALDSSGRIFLTGTNGNNEALIYAWNSGLVRIQEEARPTLLGVWPNPAISRIHIQGSPGDVAPKVLNAIGLLIELPTQRNDKGWDVDVHSLSSGAYIVKGAAGVGHFIKE